MKTKVKNLTIKQSGLMRCCIETIRLMYEENAEAEIADGTLINCRFDQADNENMVVEDGAIRWNRERFIQPT